MIQPTPARASWITALPLWALPLVLLLLASGLCERLSLNLDDALLRLTASPATFNEVVTVDIDDASLRSLQPMLGDWPYRRDVYAVLLSYLRDAGVKVVVFDIVFVGERAGDAELSRAIQQRPDVVLAAAGLRQPLEADQPADQLLLRISRPAPTHTPSQTWADATLPTAKLFGASDDPSTRLGMVGLISTPLDTDGRLRSLPLLHQVHGQLLPALPLAALLRAEAQPPDWIKAAARWPTDAEGRLHLRLPSNTVTDAVPSVAWSHVMAAALGALPPAADTALRQQLAGRALFIGSSAFFADAVMTPQGQMSGTRLLATSYALMSRNVVLTTAPWPWTWLLWLLAGVPVLLSYRGGAPVLARHLLTAAAALCTLLLIGLSLLLLRNQLAPVLGPLLVLLLGVALTALAQLRWQTLLTERLRFERAVADAANKAKSEFLANVSHEVRTPMNALLGMAELLAKSELTVTQRGHVEVFQSAGQSLFALINDLLDIAKIESGRLELHPRVFNPELLLTQQLALLQPRVEGLKLSLTLQVDASAQGWVTGDPQRLAQVVVNLVGNAIKFTRDGSVQVRLQREAQGPDVLIAVADTGIGIAPSKHELIFKPFTQADGSVGPMYGGTGLGLSISRSLVSLMGGRIWLDSRPGEGTTFFVKVPLPVAERPSSAAVHTAASSPADDPAPAALQLLLCEDNEVNVMVIEAMLLPLGHRIDVAENGAQGLQKFRTGRYDLVLMDVQMPGMDGHTATRELRRIEAAEQRRRTPVIALTANAFESDVQRSHEAGCDDHLTKPISQTALLEALARHACQDFHEASPSPQPSAPGPHPFSHLSDTPTALDAQRQQARRRDHALVFLGDWQQSWAKASADEQLQLADDLAEVADQIGAAELCLAAISLRSALSNGDLGAAFLQVDAALLPALAELSMAMPAKPGQSV